MAEKRNKKLADEIPPLAKLEGNFHFIRDATLKRNTALALQYILALIVVVDKEKIQGTSIASAFYKDMIVYYATIVEGCLYYSLKRYFEKDIVKSSDVMSSGWEIKEPKIIYKISEDEQVCGVIRFKQIEYLTNKANFIVINRAAKKAGILTKRLFKKVERLRERRNKIHLAGLRGIERPYKKSDAQKASDITTEIIQRVEKKLGALEK